MHQLEGLLDVLLEVEGHDSRPGVVKCKGKTDVSHFQ
jgi:hypothetical protein